METQDKDKNREAGKMWFQTSSGRTINLQTPPFTWPIVLADIAHALSNVCRWGGHTKRFYSVAQHSILVANHLEPHGPEVMLWGLMHDAAEAYVGDMIGPLKRFLRLTQYRSPYDQFEQSVHDAIALTFGLPKGFHHEDRIVDADLAALATENRDLCFESQEHKDWAFNSLPEPFPFPITPLSPQESEREFKKLFADLYCRVNPDATPPIDKEVSR